MSNKTSPNLSNEEVQTILNEMDAEIDKDVRETLGMEDGVKPIKNPVNLSDDEIQTILDGMDTEIDEIVRGMNNVKNGVKSARLSSKQPTSYSEEEIVRIMKEYSLNEEEINFAIDRIEQSLIVGKESQEHPIAIVVAGQPGAGKTGVISTFTQRLNGTQVIIDNDEMREEHPRVDEIKALYPELYTACTDQLSFTATPEIIKRMIDKKYNIILHQTLKGDYIARSEDGAISRFLDAGYTVVVVALAVSELESDISMLERCQGVANISGIKRLVPQENHDRAYNGLPGTIDYIEKNGKYDSIIIVKRVPYLPSNPDVIYKTVNKGLSIEKIRNLEKLGISENYNLEKGIRFGAYDSARETVETTRKIDSIESLRGKHSTSYPGMVSTSTLLERLELCLKNSTSVPELDNIEHIVKLVDTFLGEAFEARIRKQKI